LEVAVTAVRTLWHAPGGKGLVMSFGGTGFIRVFVVVTMVADQADVNRAEQRKNRGLNQADEQLHEIENKKETGAVQ
jgi:hypothetical protein